MRVPRSRLHQVHRHRQLIRTPLLSRSLVLGPPFQLHNFSSEESDVPQPKLVFIYHEKLENYAVKRVSTSRFRRPRPGG